MKTLIDTNGHIRFGVYPQPVDYINYMDYPLATPMGKSIPSLLKRIRFNQFHFIGITGPELMVGLAVVDLKYIANGFFYIYDRLSGSLIETKKLSLSGSNVSIAPHPEDVNSYFISKHLKIEFKNTKILATGKDILIDLELSPESTAPLRLCSRAGYQGWVYTQKTTPVTLSGKIEFNQKQVTISSPEYMALIDWTAGYMRRHTFWNWAATACILPDGRSFGLNLSCGVNETSFTENAFWLDGKMIKIELVNFVFNNNNPMEKWHIISNDGRVALVFQPDELRSEKVNAVAVKSRFVQLMGTFRGKVVTDHGEVIKLGSCPGWVEDHYAKW